MAFKDLREFLDLLEKEEELVRIKREVDPVYEVAAGIRKTSDIDGPALLFEKVKGSEIPVIGGLYAKRKRALLGLGMTEENVTEEFLKGMLNPVPPKIIDGKAPCQEIVCTGKEVDLTKLPICTHSEKDGGPYITVAVSEDVLILPKIQCALLDPSAAAAGTTGIGAAMGLDATRPFGVPFAEVVKVPGVEEFEIPNY